MVWNHRAVQFWCVLHTRKQEDTCTQIWTPTSLNVKMPVEGFNVRCCLSSRPKNTQDTGWLTNHVLKTLRKCQNDKILMCFHERFCSYWWHLPWPQLLIRLQFSWLWCPHHWLSVNIIMQVMVTMMLCQWWRSWWWWCHGDLIRTGSGSYKILRKILQNTIQNLIRSCKIL